MFAISWIKKFHYIYITVFVVSRFELFDGVYLIMNKVRLFAAA